MQIEPMKISPRHFRVEPHSKVNLKHWPTHVKPFYQSDDDYKKQLARHSAELIDLQAQLYATNRYSLLLIFQAMDAAGKDGAIKHVMSGVNPQGCQVFSFKHPSAEELAHDFLWRTTRCLPERGHIGIFNRSYYEEVLIVRVHPEILAAENLPPELTHPKRIWERRYESIHDLERHLYRNGTRVIKFFLHLSKEEQRKRLLARLDDPKKNWKFQKDDLVERAYWKEYMKAYEACLTATSTSHAPWFVVPADDKKNARLIVSKIVLNALASLNLEFPPSDVGQKSRLRSVRQKLKNKD